MAGASDPLRDFFRVQQQAAVAAPAGLSDAPAPRRLNLSIPAGDAGLDFTPAPGPRVATPPPGAKIKAKDVRREFDNLGFWDRITKNPEWQRGVQGVGEIREAEVTRAAKPDAIEAAALRAEADHKAALAEADRLQAAGKYSEARQKRINADADFQKAQDTNFVSAKTNEVKDAKKKAADWIKTSKKKKAEVWDARKKGAAKGGAVAVVGLGLGYLGNKYMEGYQADQNASEANQAANEIMNRILMGGETTPEEDALVIEKLRSEDAFLKLKERAGSAAPAVPPAADPVAPLREPGPPLLDPAAMVQPSADPMADLVDVGYSETSPKPDIPDVEPTYDPDVHAAILSDYGPEEAANYADSTAAEDHRRRANALTDAGIENTAAAAGVPDSIMDYLREQGDVARAADRGEMPVSDNFWNNWIAGPMQEGLAKNAEFYADPANREGSPVLRAYDALPDWMRGGIDIADTMFNPVTIASNVAATTTDEVAGMPYQFVRNTILGPGAFTGLNDEVFGPVYGEVLRSMGGETLGFDPMTAPITEGADPIYGPADMTDMPRGDMGSGTGALNAGMPSMQELAALERIGALGKNPDGSNMTVAQYIQQGNLAGAGMEPSMPMFGGMTDQGGLPPLPRLQGQPNFGGPAGLPTDPRSSLPMGGLPAAPAAPVPAAVAPPPPPGGPGDQYAGGGFFGAANAGTVPLTEEEQKAVDDATKDLAEQNETLRPRGQTDSIDAGGGKDGGLTPFDEPEDKPVPSALNWWTYGLLGDDDINSDPTSAPAPVAGEFPANDPRSYPDAWPSRYPVNNAPSAPPARTTAAVTEPSGTVGDFKGSSGSVGAGLADDAADAEAELNWINRQMRDKLGLDASQRAKAAEALIAGGAAMLASDGDGWQALGEGLQAGLGSVQAADAADAEAAAAEQDAMLEESRWRAEMALKEIQARNGGSGSGGIDKYLQVQALTEQLISQGMDPVSAKNEAERYMGVKSQASWEGGDAILSALMAGVNG